MTLQVTKGNTVHFSVVFNDQNGLVTNPPSASLVISFPSAAGYGTTTISLAVNVTTWTGAWDTTTIEKGRVFWHVISGGSTPFVAGDGEFDLVGNLANP